jgi:hypothetical protein
MFESKKGEEPVEDSDALRKCVRDVVAGVGICICPGQPQVLSGSTKASWYSTGHFGIDRE